MIESVALDFDDTLCLTEAACFEMENETLIAMGRRPMDRAIHISTWGQPLFEAIKARSPGIDVVEFKKSYDPIIADYTTSGKLDKIPEENYEAMDKLLMMGKRLLVLTSRTHAELKHLLQPDHLLASRIDTFYYKDNMQYHKPDPRAFTELLRDNNLSPERRVYVGDSVGDATASKQAGLRFVASLESGLRQKKDFGSVAVDAYIQRFPDIVEVIREFDLSA